MPSGSSKKRDSEGRVRASSGNVFKDLGLPDRHSLVLSSQARLWHSSRSVGSRRLMPRSFSASTSQAFQTSYAESSRGFQANGSFDFSERSGRTLKSGYARCRKEGPRRPFAWWQRVGTHGLQQRSEARR